MMYRMFGGRSAEGAGVARKRRRQKATDARDRWRGRGDGI
jgi:hypothetical protein